MKLYNNPLVTLWYTTFSAQTVRFPVPCWCRTINHAYELDSLDPDSEAVKKFVCGLTAWIGRVGGCAASPHSDVSKDSIVDMVYYKEDDAFIIKTAKSPYSETLTRADLLGDLIDDQSANAYFDDMAMLVGAVRPNCIPFATPGKQLTIGGCGFWPGDSNRKLTVTLTNGSPELVFWDNGDQSITVDSDRWAMILNVLIGCGDFAGQGPAPAEGWYLGLLYSNGVVGGVEIMHYAAPHGTKPSGVYNSEGSFWSSSLAQYCNQGQQGLARTLCTLPILQFTNEEVGGSTGDLTEVLQKLDGLSNQVDGQTSGLHTHLDSVITGLHAHVDNVQTTAVHATQLLEDLTEEDLKNVAITMVVVMACGKKLYSQKFTTDVCDLVAEMTSDRFDDHLRIAMEKLNSVTKLLRKQEEKDG